MKILKKFQLRLYLGAWVDNVGFAYGGIDHTLNDAMTNTPSLISWFGTDKVDYDEDYALELLVEFQSDTQGE